MLLASAALLAAVACRQARHEPDLEGLFADLQALTKPEAGAVEKQSQVERTKVSARAWWEIRTPSSWGEYRTWLAARLGGPNGFHAKSENASLVVFSRELPADVHSLTVQVLEAGPPLRVRVTFEATAW